MSVCINDTDGDGDCAACARNSEAPCRVSARGDFETWLKKWDVGHAPHTYELLDAVLDEHAHELAEKIRAELPETIKQSLGETIWEIRTIPTAGQAADLIDPEVTSGEQ